MSTQEPPLQKFAPSYSSMMKISFSRLKASFGRNPSESGQESYAGLHSYGPRTKSMSNVSEYHRCMESPLADGARTSSRETQRHCSRSTSTRSVASLCTSKHLEARSTLSDSRHAFRSQRNFLNAVRNKISNKLRHSSKLGTEDCCADKTCGNHWFLSSCTPAPHGSNDTRWRLKDGSVKSKMPAWNSVHPMKPGATSKDPSECLRVLGAASPFISLPSQRGMLRDQDKTLDHEGSAFLMSQEEKNDLLVSVAGPSLEWSLAQELRNLMVYGWYWGPMSAAEAEGRLSFKPDGAFLVRDSSDDRHVLSLSFRSCGKTRHTRIQHCNNMFSFYMCSATDLDSYPSVPELIEQSMERSEEGVLCYSKDGAENMRVLPVRLTQPVSRLTQVRSLQCLCRFVIRQRVRLDLVQQLPLPQTVKTFVEEKLF